MSFSLFKKLPLSKGVVAESGMMKAFLAFESNLCTAVFKSFLTVLFCYLNLAVSKVNTEAAVPGASSSCPYKLVWTSSSCRLSDLGFSFWSLWDGCELFWLWSVRMVFSVLLHRSAMKL